MSDYNQSTFAVVGVTFSPGTTDPLISTDSTNGLSVAYNVASVARKVGEPIGVYKITLSSPISATMMVPRVSVWCETDGKAATIHPTIDSNGLVLELEVRGTRTEGAVVGSLTDIMFILRVDNQWMSP